MTIRKRDNSWQLDYRDPSGKRVRLNFPTRDAAAARKAQLKEQGAISPRPRRGAKAPSPVSSLPSSVPVNASTAPKSPKPAVNSSANAAVSTPVTSPPSPSIAARKRGRGTAPKPAASTTTPSEGFVGF